MAPAFLVDAPGMALMWAVGMAPRKIPAHLARMRTQMQFAIIEKRWGVNALPKRYTVRYLQKDLIGTALTGHGAMSLT
ncbi:MAG: hypothetical protein KKD25_15835 [Gammaproteobacteria bacterium]|nr:hypothetical protein [Gammaproteobacteria bacterium]MBU1846382.1 hypothetical protein [Gammaproteobacteria bacterium]